MSGPPDPKPEKRLSKRDLRDGALALGWRQAVLDRDQGCLVHRNPADCEWPPQAHHVVLAQMLRRHGHADALYDRRIGMTLCSRAHFLHHTRVRPVFRDEVPAEVITFVVELGYREWFERVYPARERLAA